MQVKEIETGTFHERHARRYIRTKHVVTVIDYEDIGIRTDPVRRSRPGEGDEEQSRDNYRKRQYMRRQTVINLANMNFDNRYDKFLTLTQVPAGDGLDVQKSNERFKAFVRKMKRKYGDFRYLAVIEFTKRGAVHYHMLNTLPYVPQSKLQEEWGNIVFVTSIDHVDNLGAYIVKYMVQDNGDERLKGEKAYLCSKGLARAQEVKTWQGKTNSEHMKAMEEIEEIEGVIKGKVPVYTSTKKNEYCGVVTYRQYNLKRV